MSTEMVDMEMSPEQQYGEDAEDYYCHVCKIQCNTEASYNNHIRGMMHAQKLMQQDNAAPGVSAEAPAPIPVEDIVKRARQAQEYQEAQEMRSAGMSVGGKKGSNPEEKTAYHCEVCDVHCTGISSYEQHMNGAKHLKNVKNRDMGAPISHSKNAGKKKKKGGDGQTSAQQAQADFQINSPPQLQPQIDMCQQPLIGLQYITEYQKEYQMGEPRYVCYLCEGKCDPRTVIQHILGTKHRINYLKEHYMQYHMLVKQMPGSKTDQNNMVEEYAQLIESQEGRKYVQVRVELDGFGGGAGQAPKRKNDGSNFGGKRSRGADDWGQGGGYQGGYNGYNQGFRGGYGGGPGGEYEGYDSQGQYMGGYSNYNAGSQANNYNNYKSNDFTSDYPGGAHKQPGGEPAPGSYAAYTTQQNKKPIDQYRSSNYNNQGAAASTTSSTETPGYKGYCSKTDLNFFLQSLVNTPYSVDNEEEASLALKVSNSLTQALFQYRLKSVPKELLGGFSKQGMASAVAK